MSDGEEGWEKHLNDNFETENLMNPDKNGQYNTKTKKYTFKNNEFENYERITMDQGYVDEYWGKLRCFSSVINIPGV